MQTEMVLKKPKARVKMSKEKVTLLLFALPFVLIILAFSYVPLFGWMFAFYNFKPGLKLFDIPYAGLEFFKIMFVEGKTDLIRVLTNTLILSFLLILLSPLPVVLAIMITEVRSGKFKRFIQTTTTLPNFVSWIIVYSLAFSMFSSEGVVNQVLQQWHLIKEPLNVLGNSAIVYFFQTTLDVWKGIGWSAIIYIAAIAGIDRELYDSAKVDGAGRFRSILHITVPGIASTFIVLLLLRISNMLSAGGSFDQYFVFYNSLVSENIEVLDYYVYKVGIASGQYSLGIAIGMLKTAESLILLFGVNYLSKRLRGSNII